MARLYPQYLCLLFRLSRCAALLGWCPRINDLYMAWLCFWLLVASEHSLLSPFVFSIIPNGAYYRNSGNCCLLSSSSISFITSLSGLVYSKCTGCASLWHRYVVANADSPTLCRLPRHLEHRGGLCGLYLAVSLSIVL